ncbi:MAG TPA: hypothetical protein VMZ91_09760 [Candidatus Paceibacterota bacterium]|nr:hypothetical protein [Candidatus Paceibacterota bacterium]
MFNCYFDFDNTYASAVYLNSNIRYYKLTRNCKKKRISEKNFRILITEDEK